MKRQGRRRRLTGGKRDACGNKMLLVQQTPQFIPPYDRKHADAERPFDGRVDKEA